MKNLIIFILTAMLLTAQFSFATVRNVPGNYSTIQSALNACLTGDTVLVASGLYYENLTWPSTQSIYLKSVSGAASTIINGGGISSVIYIVISVDISTVIDGFTIKNGYYRIGAGILCSNNASPTIKNNVITQNTAYGTLYDGGGAGIFLAYSSSPRIVSNEISYNTSTNASGGGIICYDNSNPVIESNVIKCNSCAVSGGGILIMDLCSPFIINNTITNNTASNYGGGLYFQGSLSKVKFNLVKYNTSGNMGAGMSFGLSDLSQVDSNNINENNGDGICCRTGASPIINWNNICDNTPGYGLRNIAITVTINAENNWWGHASGPYHPVQNPNGRGDTVSDDVDFQPWNYSVITGIKKINKITATEYVLYQNYPNPFNPKTNIKFKLPKSALVELIVYDILGKEVAILLNKNLNSGTYEVDWNATCYPSGVYFYKLVTDDFVDVKKMIYIK